MAICEMCGKQGNINANIEGVELTVCNICVRYGVVKQSSNKLVNKFSFPKKSFNKEKISFKLIDSFSLVLQKCRQKKGLKQKDFAKFLNERESLVSKWEQGSIIPSVMVAKNLEKKLGVKLTQREKETEGEEEKLVVSNKSNEGFTLGDFIKVRKKK